MEKLLHCNRCLLLQLGTCIKFQSNRCFHLAYPIYKQTHYEVLGVSKDASAQEIKAAFLKRSKEIHPDLNPDDPSNHDKFVLVNEAYNVLGKSNSRREYDTMLQHPAMTAQPTGTYYQGPGSSYGNFYADFYHPSKAKDHKHGYYGMWNIKKRNSYKKRKEIEDEMYKENQRIYDEVRAKARKFTTAEQLEEFILKSQQQVPGSYRKPH
ncbi:hypothetical protein LSH36_162g01054 [Paralvinella palmiformis]|uniref:J domain-containing protein n=1 Tax=Paralvinella palmiformis TaxID=53620 RepID=A0AAD9JTB7_9ANNE|nr:hypothetical protein LSH36_162g01054 [Paralvinella palmiformis]